MLRATNRDHQPQTAPDHDRSELACLLAILLLSAVRFVVDLPSLDLLYPVLVVAAAWQHGRRFAGSAALVAAVAGHAVWLVTAAGPSLLASATDLGVRFAILGGVALAACAQRRSVEQRTEQAHHDPLTGVLTRRGFYDRVRQPDGSVRDRRQPAVAIFADLDGLKAVNDRYGHSEGDRVIRALADSCRTAVSTEPSAVIARFGGDELVVVLPQTDLTTGRRVAERILATFTSMTSFEDGSVSIGVASTSSLEDVDRLLRAADRAMYVAKGAGGNHYRVATGMSADPPVHHTTTIDLRHPSLQDAIW